MAAENTKLTRECRAVIYETLPVWLLWCFLLCLELWMKETSPVRNVRLFSVAVIYEVRFGQTDRWYVAIPLIGTCC